MRWPPPIARASAYTQEEDQLVTHTIGWESVEALWDAMTKHGPWEILARRCPLDDDVVVYSVVP